MIQIGGKIRGKVTLPVDADENTVWEAAQQIETVQKYLAGKKLGKKIFVPKKLLSIGFES